MLAKCTKSRNLNSKITCNKIRFAAKLLANESPIEKAFLTNGLKTRTNEYSSSVSVLLLGAGCSCDVLVIAEVGCK